MHPYKAFASIGIGDDLVGLTEQAYHLGLGHADLQTIDRTDVVIRAHRYAARKQ